MADGGDRPPPSSDAALRTMRAQKRVGTKPEMQLRSELHRRGMRYFVDRPVVPGDRRRRVDIVFPRIRLAVFVDGCFWHRCPDHGNLPKANGEWWAAKLNRNVERDRDTDRRLIDAAWSVVRVWEHENVQVAADRVEAKGESLRHSTRPSKGRECDLGSLR